MMTFLICCEIYFLIGDMVARRITPYHRDQLRQEILREMTKKELQEHRSMPPEKRRLAEHVCYALFWPLHLDECN